MMGRGAEETPNATSGRRSGPAERVEELNQELLRHKDLYYNGTPEISDAAYDALEQELEGLLAQHPELRPAEDATQIVGASAGGRGFAKVRHDTPMLSLDKVHTEDDLKTFLARFPDQKLSIWPKFDGVSLSLKYKGGRLVRAATRGNGVEGDDITENARRVQGVFDPLDQPVDCEIRGEVVMHRSDWEAYNQAHPDKKFANPRNAVSGSLGLKDPNEVANRPLRFYAFDLIIPDSAQDDTSHTLAQRISELGYQAERYQEADTAQQVIDYVRQTANDRPNLDYEIDGVVVKVADRAAYQAAGNTSHHPRAAMAYKLAAEEVETKLLDVEWNVGKTGIVAPRARLQTVFVAGTNITWATLHNLEEIGRRDVKLGDQVKIKRAGDVIPFVIGPADTSSRDGSEQTISAPADCPSCGTPLVEIGESRILKCPNSEGCPAQQQRRMIHWVSRAGADIDAVGEKVLDKLQDAGLADKPSDLYAITYAQLMPDGEPLFEGLGERSAQRIVDSVERSKQLGLRRAVIALSIPLASEGTAKRLCRAGYESLEQVAGASVEDLQQVEDVGPQVAASLHEFLNTPETQAEIRRLRSLGVNLDVLDEDKPVQAPTNGAFTGKTVVITGTLTVDRKAFQALVEQAGGKASGSVSKNTDYLIVGENAGSKRAKAESLGVTVLSEEQARAMLAG